MCLITVRQTDWRASKSGNMTEIIVDWSLRAAAGTKHNSKNECSVRIGNLAVETRLVVVARAAAERAYCVMNRIINLWIKNKVKT